MLPWTHASFPLKIVLHCFRLRLLYGACEERISINMHDFVYLRSSCSRNSIIDEDEIRQFTILLSMSDADVNAHWHVGTRLLPITSDRLSLWLIHIMLRLRDWRTHPIRINCGWVHGETHATFRTGGHSTRVVSRRLPRHNYPHTVYLRPLFNLQLMFQIAINPCQ